MITLEQLSAGLRDEIMASMPSEDRVEVAADIVNRPGVQWMLKNAVTEINRQETAK